MEEKYKYTDDMGEISGFGGDYEKICRGMVVAGLNWLDNNPGADPRFHGYSGIYGIITEDNEDAKSLSKIVVDASNNDCTGAMHQATISHILYIKKFGWTEYVKKMKEEK